MASPLPNSRSLLVLSLLLILLLHHTSALEPANILLTHNGGPLLTGNIDIALVWYGQFGRIQKHVLRSFIKSLNVKAIGKLSPVVSQWWNVVESYQEAAGKPMAPINVKVVKQIVDAQYSMGKVITLDFIEALIEKANQGSPNVLPVIIAAKDVTVHGICTGKCSVHAVLGEKQPYLLLGDPEVECPGACGWPFYKSDYGPAGKILLPPNGNIAADVLVINFANALAEAVSNPFMDGFFQRNGMEIIEAGTACKGIFGTGAVPGSTGKVNVDPKGASYNAFGSRGKKFLVPGVWNPKTKQCFTMM